MLLEAGLACHQILLTGSNQERMVVEDLSNSGVMVAKMKDVTTHTLVKPVKSVDDDIQLSEGGGSSALLPMHPVPPVSDG